MPVRAPLQKQLIRLMRWAALFSMAFALVALVLLARGDSGDRAYKFIATALGVGLSVLLGIAVMTLLFFSKRQVRQGSGPDHIKKEDYDPRP